MNCLRIVWIGLALLTVGCGPRELRHQADRLERAALKAYAQGSYAEVVQALGAQIEFLEQREQALVRYRDVDALLYDAHAHAAYLALHGGKDSDALRHLESAWLRQNRLRMRTGYQALTRSNFVDHVVAGILKERGDAELKWKAGHPLDRAAVKRVQVAMEK